MQCFLATLEYDAYMNYLNFKPGAYIYKLLEYESKGSIQPCDIIIPRGYNQWRQYPFADRDLSTFLHSGKKTISTSY